MLSFSRPVYVNKSRNSGNLVIQLLKKGLSHVNSDLVLSFTCQL